MKNSLCVALLVLIFGSCEKTSLMFIDDKTELSPTAVPGINDIRGVAGQYPGASPTTVSTLQAKGKVSKVEFRLVGTEWEYGVSGSWVLNRQPVAAGTQQWVQTGLNYPDPKFRDTTKLYISSYPNVNTEDQMDIQLTKKGESVDVVNGAVVNTITGTWELIQNRVQTGIFSGYHKSFSKCTYTYTIKGRHREVFLTGKFK